MNYSYGFVRATTSDCIELRLYSRTEDGEHVPYCTCTMLTPFSVMLLSLLSDSGVIDEVIHENLPHALVQRMKRLGITVRKVMETSWQST